MPGFYRCTNAFLFLIDQTEVILHNIINTSILCSRVEAFKVFNNFYHLRPKECNSANKIKSLVGLINMHDLRQVSWEMFTHTHIYNP